MIGLVLLFLMSVCFGFIRSSPTEQFVDESGRQVVFHGVNAVFKQAPWLPLPNASAPFNASLNENDFQLLSGWGFNFVRLGAMWPGLMPWNASLPDPSYLQALDEIVSLARKYGIFVLLDLHQDLLSPFFCGEGAPDYLVPRPDLIAKFPLPIGMPYKTDSRGYPLRSECASKSFSTYYATLAVGQGFQALYTNANGFADAFVAFWSTVSAHFADVDNVGFELLNEPYFGDVFENPGLLLPGVTDRRYLLPLYQRAVSAIRKNDFGRHPIFFEPAVGDIGFSGFDHTPNNDTNSVYSYHVYCPEQPSENDKATCFKLLDLQFDFRQGDRKRIGAGAMMTEFGAWPNDEASAEFARHQIEACESEGQSWSYWQYKFYDDPTTAGNDDEGLFFAGNGTLQEVKIRSLVRSYVRRVQGTLQSSRFDADSGSFSLSFQANTLIAAPTEIFLSPFFYPGGARVSINPPGAATYYAHNSLLFVTSLQNGTISVSVV